MAATESGDLEALTQLLASDVRVVTDGGGKVSAALNVIEGADRAARFLIGASRKGARAWWRDDFRLRFATINGLPGVIVQAPEGSGADRGLRDRRTAWFEPCTWSAIRTSLRAPGDAPPGRNDMIQLSRVITLLAVAAAHAATQPATVKVYTMTPGRFAASSAVVLGLVGAVIG